MKIKKTTAYVLLLTALVTLCSSTFASGEEKSAAPVAENLEFSTYRDVSLEGQLKASSISGLPLYYEITTPPAKGKVQLTEGGYFVYTPKTGKKGRDYFGYKVYDSRKTYSSEATVIISIKKQKTVMSYADMQGAPAQYAALRLAEEGIFVGEYVGGHHVFRPDAPVLRSEFLTMCMKLTGLDVLSGVITTGFSDDAAIEPYLKPYVSTALLTGIISGYSNGRDTAVFRGDDYISFPEAAVMLSRSLNISDVDITKQAAGIPAWAAQECANLSACRIYSYSPGQEGKNLSRGKCAGLLLAAMELLEKR